MELLRPTKKNAAAKMQKQTGQTGWGWRCTVREAQHVRQQGRGGLD
jgi:hypothetical protein